MSTFRRCDICGAEITHHDPEPPILNGTSMNPRGLVWRLYEPWPAGVAFADPGKDLDVCGPCSSEIRFVIASKIADLRFVQSPEAPA